MLLLVQNLAHSQSDLGQKTFEVRQFLCLGWGWWGVGADGVWMQTVKAKIVECLGKTPFGKAKSLIVLVLFMGGLCI